MSFFRTLLLLIMAALLTACESGLDRRYLDVSLNQPLELPPDLSPQDSQSNFDLPQVFSGDDPSQRDKVPVLAQVDTLQLQGSSDVYWLSVEAPVEDLYQKVKDFWAAEGYGLVIDEPVIGIMQTEWIYKEEGGDQKSDSWWDKLFATKDLSASQDQFRTRIERDPAGKNRIYIVHRGTEYVHEFRVGDRAADESRDNEWQFRRSEPELEVEMLSRLMIYLGLQQDAVDAQVERVKLFKPRASMRVDAEEKSPFLILFDPYHIAWNRIYLMLQRMNFEIEVAEFKSGLSQEGVITVKADVVKDVDEGFFLFGADEERETRKFTLVLSEETHELTRLILEDQKGNFDTTPEGAEFISLLYEELK